VAENIDKEIEKETEAIRTVVQALEPLRPEVRAHVVSYVLTRLGIVLSPQIETLPLASVRPDALLAARETERQLDPAHIKDLKDQKKPRSDNEMAALVAYYLENLAPQKERKDRITSRDIDTYFKIAEFPVPERSRMTLVNAKGAGYLDAVGNGEYKLNAVGHNLVVHSMPRGAGETASKRRPRKRGQRAAKKR
jgi:hypothetical protein